MTLTTIENIIPASNSNRPGYSMVPEYITIHETANTSPGANSQMHYIFLLNGGGPEGVSFHWCVDDAVARHFIPDNENAWHAGDGANGTGNRKSIAIETCVNADGNWSKTLVNLAELTAMLCTEHKIPVSNVVEHNHWSGKDCPHVMRIPPPYFPTELETITAFLNKSSEPDHLELKVPGFGTKWVVDELYQRYSSRDDSLTVWGLPLTGMFAVGETETQVFERAIMTHTKNVWPEKFDTLLERIGYTRALANKYIGPTGIIANAAFEPEIRSAGTKNTDTYNWFAQTQHSIQHGFLAFWQKHGDVDVFGYPLSTEFVEGQTVVQYFERARFEWHPGKNPTDFDVLLGRLGAELLEAKLIPGIPT